VIQPVAQLNFYDLITCVDLQVRAEEDGELSIVGATAFAGGLADALLAIHYLGVLLTEIRHMSPQFQVKY
jgi:hypothetical protein